MEPQHLGLAMIHQHDQIGPIRQIRAGLRLDSIDDRPVPLHFRRHEVGQRPQVWRNRTTSESVWPSQFIAQDRGKQSIESYSSDTPTTATAPATATHSSANAQPATS
ncbi:unnamed protein product, partial [Mesorhabditis belari]|uniref:Uncharacterized protein n=1 Tax=Mesorhabditis belari TaxID=2138241 RepID=A0AAF3J8I5_9BILA